MTHDALVECATKWLLNSYGCGFALPEFVACNNSGEIADVLGFKYGYSILIECKTSREDFKKDASKPFRIDPAKGMGDYRFYMCPPGVITIEDLPEKWGLLHAHEKNISKVISAEFIGGNLINERIVFASVIRRAHLQGDLKKYLRMPKEGRIMR